MQFVSNKYFLVQVCTMFLIYLTILLPSLHIRNILFLFSNIDLTTTLLFTGSAVPYSFQNGVAVFPLPGQEYPILTQVSEYTENC